MADTNNPTPKTRSNVQPKRHRRHGISRHPDVAKKLFIDLYRQHGTIYRAASEIGVDRTTIYDWAKTDPDFDLAMRAAYEDSTDHLEDTLYNRALDGNTEIGWRILRGRRRHVYGDHVRTETSGPGGGPIEVQHTTVDGDALAAAEQAYLASLPAAAKQLPGGAVVEVDGMAVRQREEAGE
jgi:hypothetical protein